MHRPAGHWLVLALVQRVGDGSGFAEKALHDDHLGVLVTGDRRVDAVGVDGGGVAEVDDPTGAVEGRQAGEPGRVVVVAVVEVDQAAGDLDGRLAGDGGFA